MNPELFLTKTLQAEPWGPAVSRILAAALDAVDPYEAVAQALRVDGPQLIIGDRAYDLAHIRRVLVVGAGKAGEPMARAVTDRLAGRVEGGVVVVKDGHATGAGPPNPLQILETGHPLPDARGRQAADRMEALLAGTADSDLVICLISGGGSALLHQLNPPLSLEDLRSLTDTLLACGATIQEINTLRKHLDRIKGGGLARMASPARVLTLILSDIVGNPLDLIASGPTVPDPSTFAEAYAVFERYGILARVPAAVRAHLEAGARGEVPETPKPGDPLFNRVQNVLVGSNSQAAAAACHRAAAEGFHTLLLTTYLTGEAREAGGFLAGILRQLAEPATGPAVGPVLEAAGAEVQLPGEQKVLSLGRPACVVAGGETTVTLGDAPESRLGKGGRNQELALAAVVGLADLPAAALVTLATDGGDGPTDAAGAVVTGGTMAAAQAAGLDPLAHLARHDAYPFFEALGDLLRPGPTLTNVNDLAFLFAF